MNRLYKDSILYNFIYSHSCGILIFSETKLAAEKSRKLYALKNYRTYTIPALSCAGGTLSNGMCLLIRDDFLPYAKALKCDSKYILPVKIDCGDYTLIFMGIYIPPFKANDHKGEALASSILQKISDLIGIYHNLGFEIFLQGDMNARSLRWGVGTNPFTETFETWVEQNHLDVLNSTFARGVRTFHGNSNDPDHGSCVDLSLVYKGSKLSGYIDEFVVQNNVYTGSDHYPIYTEFNIPVTQNQTIQNTYIHTFNCAMNNDVEILTKVVNDFGNKWINNVESEKEIVDEPIVDPSELKSGFQQVKINPDMFFGVDFAKEEKIDHEYLNEHEQIIRDLEKRIDISNSNTFHKVIDNAIEMSKDIDKNPAEIIYNTFMYELYDSIIQHDGFKYRSNSKYNIKRSNSVPIKLRKILDRINHIFDNNGSNDDLKQAIRDYDIQVRKIRNYNTKNFLKNLSVADKISSQMDFYSMIKKLDLDYNFPLHDENDNPVIDDIGKCELVMKEIYRLSNTNPNDFSQEVKQKICRKAQNYYNIARTSKCKNKFTTSEIKLLIDKIPNNKSSFYDRITWRFLKVFMCNDSSSEVLTLLINSLYIDFIYLPFKKLYYTRTVAIPKKGIPHTAKDMRLLRLKSFLYTIIDKLLLGRISKQLQDTISRYQFAYKTGYGCEDSLMLFRALYTWTLVENKELHMLIVDYMKAFDMASVDLVICVAFEIGIDDWRLPIIRQFYKETVSCADIKGVRSLEVDIRQGTGQGFAVSGPFFNTLLDRIIPVLSRLKIELKPYGIATFLSIYADDLLLLASSNRQCQSLANLLSIATNSIAFNHSLPKFKYVQINVPPRWRHRNQIWVDDKPITKSNNFLYLGIDFSFLNSRSLVITSHVSLREDKGKKAYYACMAKNIFGGPLDIKLQLRLVDTLFKSTLEHGIRLFKYTKKSCLDLEKWYTKALVSILGVNPNTYRIGLFLILGKIPFKIRNDIQLLCSFHRQMRYNPKSPSRLMLEGEYKLFVKNNYTLPDNVFSYISDIYKIMSEYGLEDFFELREIRQWHKKEFERKISKVIYEKEFHKVIYLLNTGYDSEDKDQQKLKKKAILDYDKITGTNTLLASSITSVVLFMKNENKKFLNASPEDQENLRFYDKLYFGCYFYKLIGIDPNHEIKDHHRFLISFYLKSHPVYWKNNRKVCRFCFQPWKFPIKHLAYECCDVRLLEIRYGFNDPNSDYFIELFNDHGKNGSPVLYDFIYIKHFIKWLYIKYKHIINNNNIKKLKKKHHAWGDAPWPVYVD